VKLLAYSVVGVALLLAQPALGACELSLQPASASSVTHDPFSALSTQMSFAVSVTNRSAVACTASLVLAPPGGRYVLTSGSDQLAYQIRSPEGQYEGTQSTPITLSIPPEANRTVTFDAEIPRGVAAPGLFVGEVEARLLSNQDVLDRTTISLRASVSTKAQMTITGTRSAPRQNAGPNTALLDLGVLENGDQGTVFINVFANSSVKVTLQSENSGTLRLVSNTELPAIPYEAVFAGENVSLSTPVLVTKTPPLTAQGASYPLTITVPSIDGRYAGIYRDVITVSIDTN